MEEQEGESGENALNNMSCHRLSCTVEQGLINQVTALPYRRSLKTLFLKMIFIKLSVLVFTYESIINPEKHSIVS